MSPQHPALQRLEPAAAPKRQNTATPAAAPAPARSAVPLRVVPPAPAWHQPEPAPQPSAPPSLRPRQRVLERRLRAKAHLSYLGLAWHQRTHLFTEAWDQARKRCACVLGTYFTIPGPRWQHHLWWHFDQGRRLADLFGVRYEDWIRPQFARLEALGQPEAAPSDLHGRVALEAYLFGGAGPAMPQAPAAPGHFPSLRPFANDSYDRQDPEHNLYVVGILAEMIDLTGMLGDGRGLNTDSVSADDLWLVLASFDAALLIPRPQPVPEPTPWHNGAIDI